MSKSEEPFQKKNGLKSWALKAEEQRTLPSQ
jgi:hypothetical protein